MLDGDVYEKYGQRLILKRNRKKQPSQAYNINIKHQGIIYRMLMCTTVGDEFRVYYNPSRKTSLFGRWYA